MKIHIQIEYERLAVTEYEREMCGDMVPCESLLSAEHTDPIIDEFIEEFKKALKSDPHAKLNIGGECTCYPEKK